MGLDPQSECWTGDLLFDLHCFADPAGLGGDVQKPHDVLERERKASNRRKGRLKNCTT
jgi:hypothetical protein